MRHIFLLYVLFFTLPAWATFEDETVFFEGNLSEQQINNWSRPDAGALPPSGVHPNYLLQPNGRIDAALSLILKLSHFKNLQIVTRDYPRAQDLALWQAFAGLGGELVLFEQRFPTRENTEVLNQIGLRKIIFLQSTFPSLDPTGAENLLLIQSPISFTFQTGKFPAHPDMPSLQQIPTNVPLLFAADQTPWYTHMDVFNLLGHPVSLRIRGTSPTETSAEYIAHIKNLQSIAIETDFHIPATVWERLSQKLDPQISFTWIVQDLIPPKSSIEAFESATDPRTRKIVLHHDWGFTASEYSRLQGTSLPIKWVHVPL